MKFNGKCVVLTIAVLALLYTSCSKSDKGIKPGDPGGEQPSTKTTVPALTTAAPSAITTITAIGGGQVTSTGNASITERGVVLSTSPAPTINSIKVIPLTVSGSGVFECNITGLQAATKYYLRAFATNSAGTGYGNEISFTTDVIGNATFKIDPLFIIGNSIAHSDIEILTDGGDIITERGVCWGLSENPTINDSKTIAAGQGVGKYRAAIVNLQPRTAYNVRAYAKNSKGVSYSSNIKFKTIGRGNLTYTFNKSATPATEELAAYARLQIAIDSAVWYINNYTSVVKHVWLNYVPGVATADANNEGWMRFGTGEGYQNLRTMLHELNHTFGTGTTSWWSGKIVGGKYQGSFANEMLNKIQRSTGVLISGDSQHWWPYGLNQNSEVSSSWDYIYNCIIIEQMRRDGLSAAGAWTE